MTNYQQITPFSYIPLSISATVNTLLYGTKWGGGLGFPVTLTYSFANPGVSQYSTDYDDFVEYWTGSNSSNFIYSLSSNQESAVRSALAQWSSVANLSFTEVSDTAGGTVGDLRFGGYKLIDWDTAAFAFLPGASPLAGDVWIGPVTNEVNPSGGSYDYLTFLHEIGHALGLKHPFEASGSSNYVLRGAYDDVRYTVMSYNDTYDFLPTGPMLYDIAAMQYIYGSNDTWQTGDNVYSWDANARIFETIWDAGGNDTIDASNQSAGVVINLNSGEFSSIGQSIYNYATGAGRNNFLTIAYGSVIENAIGSDYKDTLIGNSADNVLDGGKGEDVLRGGAGNDTYYVDLPTGSDFYDRVTEYAGEGYDKVVLRGTSTGFFGRSFALANNVEEVDASQTGAVALTLLGNNSANRIIGNAGNNLLNGGAGADTMIGGAGNDTYVVDHLGDEVIEQVGEGIDLVQVAIATAGGTYTLGDHVENATLTNSVSFNLVGNTLSNTLVGNAANNLLDGGAGADVMNGGAGNDTYVVDDIGDQIIDSAGIDTVLASISYTLGNDLENLSLLGSEALNGTGNGLANVITGNDGSNVLDGGGGVDTLRGGKGDDTYIVDLTSRNTLEDSVLENLHEGNDTIQLRGGNAALATVTAIALANNVENLDASATGTTRLNLTGNVLNNILIGNAADNLLNGGAGADRLIGGDGNDTYVVDNLGDEVIEQAGEGTDLVQVAIATAGGTYTLGEHVENATLTNKVAFNLTGNALSNTLVGNAANNVLDGGLGADVMNGGAGNDTYIVDDVGDTIIDSAGIDTVRASIAYTLGKGLENLVLTGSHAVSGTGNALANILDGSQNNAANELRGLGGNDTYIVGAGDTVIEEANGGIDLVQAYVSYTLGDHVENLSLLGSEALNGIGNGLANVLTGNDGSNVLDGGGGVDTLRGGKGDDTYIVDLMANNALEDRVVENANEGIDTIVLRGGSALPKAATIVLANNVENLDASGTGSIALNLTGNAANNLLIGNQGNNTLNGGDGNDTLIGMGGFDTLTGGRGADTFRFDLSWLGMNSGPDAVITDFRRLDGDKIQLQGEDAERFSFVGRTFDTGATGSHQLRFDAGTLYGSVDSGMSNAFEIRLLGMSELRQDDFLFG